MAEYSDWRNFWWLNVAIHAFIFVACIPGFPETKWHRAHPGDASATKPEALKLSSSGVSNEKNIEQSQDIDRVETEKQPASHEIGLSKQDTAMRDPFFGKGTPSKRQFNLFQPNANAFKSIFLDLWIPWKMFAFPIVEFASFVVSWSASCFLTLNLTQSQVFAEPPYSFSPLGVGFTNFAVFVGSIVGLFSAGPLSDWVSARLTARNRGIREPEMRLLTMIPYVIIMLIGNFVVAFGYENKWDWRVGISPHILFQQGS